MNPVAGLRPRLSRWQILAGLVWLAAGSAQAAEEAWAVELDALRVKVAALAAERQQQRVAADDLGKAHGDILTRLRRSHDAVAGRSGPGAVLSLLTDGAPEQASLGTIMEDAVRRRDALVKEAASVAAEATASTELAMALGDWPYCRSDLAVVNRRMEGLRDRLGVLARELHDFRTCLGKIRVAQSGWPAVRAAAARLQTEVETVRTEAETRAKACEDLVRELNLFEIKRDMLLRRIADLAKTPGPAQAGSGALDQIVQKLPAYPSEAAMLQTGIRLQEDRKEAERLAGDLKRRLAKANDLWRSVQGRPFEDGVRPVWKEWQTAAVPMLEAVQGLLDACGAQQKRAVAQRVRIEESERRFRTVSAESSKLKAEAESALQELETRLAASAGAEQRRLQAEAQAERERVAGLQALQEEADRGLQDSNQAAENAKSKAKEVEKARGILSASDPAPDLLEFDEDAVQLPGR